jgi:hypothetical protein
MAARSVVPAMGFPQTVPMPARVGRTHRVRMPAARSASFMGGPIAQKPSGQKCADRAVTKCYAEKTEERTRYAEDSSNLMPKLKVRIDCTTKEGRQSRPLGHSTENIHTRMACRPNHARAIISDADSFTIPGHES